MTETKAARGDIWVLVGIACVVALVHVLTNGRYGFHRDELQFLSDAKHLDWAPPSARTRAWSGCSAAQVVGRTI